MFGLWGAGGMWVRLPLPSQPAIASAGATLRPLCPPVLNTGNSPGPAYYIKLCGRGTFAFHPSGAAVFHYLRVLFISGAVGG